MNDRMNDRNGIWIEEKALAPRDPGTGDERLPCVAGGWFYDDGALRVRLRRSRTIAGIWKHGASPTGRHTFTTWRHWTRDDAPLPSGLLGPVGIESRSPVSAAPGGDPRIAAVLEAAREHGAEVTDVKQTGGCVRVDYVLRPTEESFIRCLVAFPAETPWSGRFWGFGNGGAAGNVWVDEEAIRRGDVAAHTDLGTSKGAWSKREVIKDFGWRATHLMTVSAKAMTEAYFGRKPSKCYFFGSSTGGGQGFHEALRFPEDYDGIVAMTDWCGRAAKECGGEDQLSQSCRLYLLPGRGHGPTSGRGCGNVIGDRDLIVRWVENGERPAEVVAELNGGGSMPVRPWKST